MPIVSGHRIGGERDMRQAVRRKVVRYEDRLLPPPFDKWGLLPHAILSCGHAHNVSSRAYLPKRMACWPCETEKAAPSREPWRCPECGSVGSQPHADMCSRSIEQPPSGGGKT